MRPTIIVFAVAFAAISAVGCSSEKVSAIQSSSTASSAAEAGSFCEAVCQKISSCDTGQDLQTCTESCESKNGSTIEKLRAEVTSEARACWEKSDCRQVLSGDRLPDCIEEAAVSVSPTPAAKSFCDALGSGLEKCDMGLDRADCLATTKVYSDETIEHAKKCTTKTCSNVMDCVNATF